jgi:hypothetical protein
MCRIVVVSLLLAGLIACSQGQSPQEEKTLFLTPVSNNTPEVPSLELKRPHNELCVDKNEEFDGSFFVFDQESGDLLATETFFFQVAEEIPGQIVVWENLRYEEYTVKEGETLWGVLTVDLEYDGFAIPYEDSVPLFFYQGKNLPMQYCFYFPIE